MPQQDTPDAPTGATHPRAARLAFIEKLTAWLMPDRHNPELAAEARERTSIDGIYTGRSVKIKRAVYLAHLRGIRRGVAIAWEARQPITLRQPVTDQPCEPDVLADLLSLVMQPGPPAEVIATWTSAERIDVEAWAAREHLSASDNKCERLSMPAVLVRAVRSMEAGS